MYHRSIGQVNVGVGSTTMASKSFSYIDNDVSDLLQDNFGIFVDNQNGNKEYEDKEFDKNLSEILEDLQNAVKEEDITMNNNNSIEDKGSKPSDKIQEELARRQKAAEDPIRKLLEIQKELEYEMEVERIEKLRNPKFQTLPAYKKRAKQEAQWRAAICAARQAQSLGLGNISSQNEAAKMLSSTSSNNNYGYRPLLPKPKPKPISKLDLTSLDLPEVPNHTYDEDCFVVESESRIPSTPASLETDVSSTVKSHFMINTKKHLSASNHFPANSRIFNRSLQELQKTAEAISKRYISVATEPLTNLEKVENISNSSAVANQNVNILRNDPMPFTPDQDVSNIQEEILVVGSKHKLPTIVEPDPKMLKFQRPSNPPTDINRKVVKPPVTRSNYYDHISSGQNFSSKPKTTTIPFLKSSTRQLPKSMIPFIRKPVNISQSFPSQISPVNNSSTNIKKTVSITKPGAGSRHLPVGQVPRYFPITKGTIRLPAFRNSKQNLLTNPANQNRIPIVLNRKIPSTTPIPRIVQVRQTQVKKLKPCSNCEKLAKYLPFLGYSWRKQMMLDHQRSRTFMTNLTLLCENCGLLVRETVISGDQVKLDHASAMQFPTFLQNTSSNLGESIEESQNFIRIPS